MADTALSIVPYAVMMMTGRPGSALRTFSSTSMPLIPGMVISVITASKGSFWKSANPSSPLAAGRTA